VFGTYQRSDAQGGGCPLQSSPHESRTCATGTSASERRAK